MAATDPGARRCPHARHPSAADEPHDVDLVRRLIEHRTAALRRVEFFRTAGAIKIIGVVYGVDHAYGTEVAALYQPAQARNRCVE